MIHHFLNRNMALHNEVIWKETLQCCSYTNVVKKYCRKQRKKMLNLLLLYESGS